MIRRAYEICSTAEELNKELMHLRKVFTEINCSPSHLVDTTMKSVKEDRNRPKNEETKDKDNENKMLTLKMAYAGEKGEGLIKDLNRTLSNTLPTNVRCRIRTGTKLQRNFNIKDKLEESHKSNIVYQHKCQNKRCKDDYIGKTERRKEVRTNEHGEVDKQSRI